MVTLVIRTKKPTFNSFARPGLFDRLAHRIYEARMKTTIGEIRRKTPARSRAV